MRRTIIQQNVYHLCSDHPEDANHALWGCSKVRQVWQRRFGWLVNSQGLDGSFSNLVHGEQKVPKLFPCLLLRPGLSGTIETNLVSRQPRCRWEDLLNLQKIICIILQTQGINSSIPCEEQQQQLGEVRRVKNWLKSTLMEHYLVSRRVQGLAW